MHKSVSSHLTVGVAWALSVISGVKVELSRS